MLMWPTKSCSSEISENLLRTIKQRGRGARTKPVTIEPQLHLLDDLGNMDIGVCGVKVFCSNCLHFLLSKATQTAILWPSRDNSGGGKEANAITEDRQDAG